MSEKAMADLFARHEKIIGSLDSPRKAPEALLVVCMDERTALTEEALGLDPSRVFRFASGGGKIEADDFVALFGKRLVSMPADSRRVLLATHEVVGHPDLGCAAFKNDIAEQERYFLALRRALAGRLGDVPVHALCTDTSTDAARPIEIDPRDDSELAARIAAGIGPQREAPKIEGHAGRGIYVGEAYRAWVSDRNDFFHINADAPSLRGDLDIALSVMLHHSAVRPDADHPLILHVDYPEGGDIRPESRGKIDAAVDSFLSCPDAQRLKTDGLLCVVRTATDIGNWSAQLL